MPIRQLPPDVAAKIAAGEVVERPASVVKELVENALDAGARQIRVDLAGGGLDLIRVADDGCGMPASELPLAFARHATSKIGALADLERIGTLGFRGEALASIASVARVTLQSRVREAEVGAQLAADEGAIGAVSPAGTPAGTSITVRGLFASVPARLKFLKTRTTEAGHCLRLVEQYALAYPEVRFGVTSEGRQVFATAGDGKLFSVMVAVYGLSVAELMVPLPGAEEAPAGVETSGEQRDGPRVSGYVSRPSCYKATRQYLSFFVNGRWVQSRTLNYAVEEAYHSLLLAGRHPIAVVSITLDSALLDVNVHPSKTEIKFLRERQVYSAVHRAVRAAVIEKAQSPEVSAGVFTVPGWAPTAGEELRHEAVVAAEGASQGASAALDQARLWHRTAGGDVPARGAAGGFAVPGIAADAPVGGDKLPALRVLGQVSQSYIISEGPDGMYLVDQHAAHERILLEHMIADWRARADTAQLLLEPLAVEVAPAEREALEEHLEALRSIGFDIEPFGAATFLIRAVPATLAAQARSQPLHELLVELAGADKAAAGHGETWEEHALANIACKAAIKAGQSLSPEEQRELIRQLEGVDAHQSCCHGRPTMVHLSLAALEREFDRR
jgi:DNA mismatch repair protein MutL